MLAYPMTVSPTADDDGFTVRVRDLPEAIAFVDRVDQAAAQAAGAIQEALAGRIADRDDIPVPSPAGPGDSLVAVPTQLAIKALLWQATKARGWRRADLARALGWTQSQVDRLFDPHHATRHEQIDQAAAALGKRLTIGLRDAA